MPAPSTSLKASCALLLAGTQCGTGFLVSADRLFTCAHVIKDAGDGPIVATFSHGRYEAVVDLVDAQNDCALLLLKQPVPARDAQPLAIATDPIPRSGEWLGYGFPAVAGSAGLLIDGRVQDPEGQDPALRPSVVLQSMNVTAGSLLAGFSGSPVLLSGRVIGQLRTIIPDESGGAQMAVIYACPAAVLADLAQKRLGAGPLPARNPYHGLDAYAPEDAADFFGREALTERLWQRFGALYSNRGQARLLTILGPSGSGKSSVMLAGFVPALRARPIPGPHPPRIILCRPGNHPVESLARALLPLLPPTHSMLAASRVIAIEQLLLSDSSKGEGLRRYAAELPDIVSAPLVLVVDQFEEIYTHCEVKAERDAFVGLLQHAVTHRDRHVSMAMTLRSDFLGEMQREHPELMRVVGEQAELVTAMSGEEIRRAIAMPAQRAGKPLDEATIELLLAQTRNSEAALPLLAVALTRIWEEMIAGNAPSTTIREIGGVGGALAGQAQRLYDALNDAEKAIARRALVRLVRFGDGSRDTRRRRPVHELCGRDVTEAQVLSILRRFAMEGSRLLSLSGAGGNQVAEVTHEALFEHWNQFRCWIEEGRADHRFHERLIEAAKLWQEANRPPGRLWRPPDLDLLRDYLDRRGDELGDLETAFYTAAARQWNAERAAQDEADRKLRAAAEENAQLKAQLSRREPSRKPGAEMSGLVPESPTKVAMGDVSSGLPVSGSPPGKVRTPVSVEKPAMPAASTTVDLDGDGKYSTPRSAAAALPRPKPGPLLARGADWFTALQRLRRDAVFATRLGSVSQDLAVDVTNLEGWLGRHPEHIISMNEFALLRESQAQHEGCGMLIAALLAARLPSRVPRNEVHSGNMTVGAGVLRVVLGNLRVDGNLMIRGKLLVLGNLQVEGYLRDSRLERAELIVAGDVRSQEGLISRGFVGVGGRLAAPYVHLSSSQGCTKILDGCEARLFIKSGHAGSRIFGPLRIFVLLADDLKLDDDAKKPRSDWNDVLSMLPPALQKEIRTQDPSELGSVISEHLQKEGRCPLRPT